ncbi:hypothetical protein [Acetivibrio cellulolyticus]|uniref:hypothetical protein n=1 Tax=Acetivibrio cellulolyticus TaxID=35830 RepID=UPI0001E2F60F|nr:hypothetical protein [Acetivibrio cellulolyticus]
MEKTFENGLVSQIISFELIDDYWQLKTDEYVANIYNPLKITDMSGKNLELNHCVMAEIKNCMITSVNYQAGTSIDYVLDVGKKLIVSLKDNDYTGPEALTIYFKTGEIITVE